MLGDGMCVNATGAGDDLTTAEYLHVYLTLRLPTRRLVYIALSFLRQRVRRKTAVDGCYSWSNLSLHPRSGVSDLHNVPRRIYVAEQIW